MPLLGALHLLVTQHAFRLVAAALRLGMRLLQPSWLAALNLALLTAGGSA